MKRLFINDDAYILIELADKKLFTEDDAVLSLVVMNKKFFIEQDSYEFEIKYILKYFSDPDNYEQNNHENICKDYFIYQKRVLRDCDNIDVHEFDRYVAFSNENITVFFYKKYEKYYCSILYSDFKSEYKTILEEELSKEKLQTWNNILT